MNSKPLKTKSFYGLNTFSGSYEYEEFIKKNPHIEIVSTIVVTAGYILLTYR